MMDNNEILNQAIKLKYLDFKDNVDNQTLLSQAHKIIFGVDLCMSCPGDILNGYYQIIAHLKNPLVMQKTEITSNFKLKEGVVLTDHSDGKMYSNANLTDEAAASILSGSPGSVKWFETIPAGFSVEKVEPSGAGTDDATKHLDEAMEMIKDDSTTLKMLQAIAEENHFPESEWKGIKTKGGLREYLKEKING